MQNPVTTQNAERNVRSRGRFFRDAVMFQGKLAIDGLRDLVLMPASLIAALLDLVSNSRPPGQRFYDVVTFGKQTEQWINLFGAADHHGTNDMKIPGLDDLVDEIERAVKAQRESGEMSGAARQAFDRIAAAARKATGDPGQP